MNIAVNNYYNRAVVYPQHAKNKTASFAQVLEGTASAGLAETMPAKKIRLPRRRKRRFCRHGMQADLCQNGHCQTPAIQMRKRVFHGMSGTESILI